MPESDQGACSRVSAEGDQFKKRDLLSTDSESINCDTEGLWTPPCERKKQMGSGNLTNPTPNCKDFHRHPRDHSVSNETPKFSAKLKIAKLNRGQLRCIICGTLEVTFKWLERKRSILTCSWTISNKSSCCDDGKASSGTQLLIH